MHLVFEKKINHNHIFSMSSRTFIKFLIIVVFLKFLHIFYMNFHVFH
jgi:hypothetical protein